MESIFLVLKGFILGIANIIPGVSGGTLALTLGIYEDIIDAISHFFKKIKKHIKFLLPLAIGIVLAILTMSRVIDYSYTKYPLPTSMFFMGLVIGGIPLLFKKVRGRKAFNDPKNFIIMAITFSIVLMLALSEQLFGISNGMSFDNMSILGYFALFLAGVIAAATMVVPGVSGSLVLMLLGYYYPILAVVKSLTAFENLFSNIVIAGIFGLGVLSGIVGVAKLIEYLLKKHEVRTYFGVIGFILASIAAIPIATINNVENLTITIPQFIIGIIVLTIGAIIGNKLGDK